MKKSIANNLLCSSLLLLPIVGGSLAGCSTVPKQESTGQYFDSSVITAKVKARLLADKQVKSLPITVKTYKNIVQLSGFVESQAQAARAVAIAQSTPGVVEVRNTLLVKYR